MLVVVRPLVNVYALGSKSVTRGWFRAARPPGQAAEGGVRALDLEFDRSTLGKLRKSVAACAASAGFSWPRAADITFAVHELAANVVVHGRGTGRVRVQVTGRELVFQVAGNLRHGGDSAGAEASPWPIQPGHGLWLVRQLADRLSVEAGPAGSQSLVTVAFALAVRPEQ